MEKKRLNNKGFTLIELLVVFVILAVLASIMIPSLSGYIKKQKQKEAIQECKQVVAASQNYFMDKLAKNQIVSLGLQESNTAERAEVLKLAGVTGTLQGVPVFDGTPSELNPSPTYKVTKLAYKSSNGFTVKYEANPQNGADYYTIVDSKTYSELEDFIADYRKRVEEMLANGVISGSPSRELVTWNMLKQYGGTLPQVDPALLKSDLLAQWTGNLYWQPYYINGNGGANKGLESSTLTVLFATPQNGLNKDGSLASSDTIKNGWNAFFVYVNGTIYETTKFSYTWDGKYINGSKGNIASISGLKTEAELKAWFENPSNGFRKVE